MKAQSYSSAPVSVEERSLLDRLRLRMAVEARFAELGHTYRHGSFYRKFEHRVTRPALKFALQSAGLYPRGKKNALSPVLRSLEFYFAGLPASLDGFEILQVSDLHIDGTPGLVEALQPILRQVIPDVCVLTGDYRFEDHGPCEAVYPLMRQLLPSIRTRHGIYGILGNHDISEMAFRLEEMGIQMLVNEAAEIAVGAARLALIGVDDPFDYQCHDLQRASGTVHSDSFRVLLAHAPELYDEAERAGIELYLAGHTHAGQIRIPPFGSIRHNANCPREYAYGPWRHGRMQGYTSSGAGCSSLPIRFNCPPEIVLIKLRSSQN